MPAYDMECTKCNHIQEVVCSYEQRAKKKCNKCKGKLKALIRPPNVVIKPKDKATYSVEKYYGK